MQGEAGGLSKLFLGWEDNADLVDNKFTLEVPHPKPHPIYATGKTCNAILLSIESVGKKFPRKKKKKMKKRRQFLQKCLMRRKFSQLESLRHTTGPQLRIS